MTRGERERSKANTFHVIYRTYETLKVAWFECSNPSISCCVGNSFPLYRPLQTPPLQLFCSYHVQPFSHQSRRSLPDSSSTTQHHRPNNNFNMYNVIFHSHNSTAPKQTNYKRPQIHTSLLLPRRLCTQKETQPRKQR